MKKLLPILIIVIVFVFGLGMSRRPPAPDPQLPPSTAGDTAVVMIPGMWGTPYKDLVFGSLKNALINEGIDPELIFIVDMMDSFFNGMCIEENVDIVEEKVKMASSLPSVNNVILIGHSRGGFNIMTYVRERDFLSTKLKKVITLAGANNYPLCGAISQNPEGLWYMSVYVSPTDGIVSESLAYLDGGINIPLDSGSHGGVPRDPEVIDIVVGEVLTEIALND